MAFVDEHYVAAQLAAYFAALTHVRFVAEEADDDSEDAAVAVLVDGEESDLSVQVGGGYMGLNQYEYEGDRLVAMRHLGMYGVQPDDFALLYRDLGRQLAIKSMAAQILEQQP